MDVSLLKIVKRASTNRHKQEKKGVVTIEILI
jgi:hypothetical protein